MSDMLGFSPSQSSLTVTAMVVSSNPDAVPRVKCGVDMKLGDSHFYKDGELLLGEGLVGELEEGSI